MTDADWISVEDEVPEDQYELVLIDQQGGYNFGRYIYGQWMGKRGNTPLMTTPQYWAHLPPHRTRRDD